MVKTTITSMKIAVNDLFDFLKDNTGVLKSISIECLVLEHRTKKI